MSVAQSAGAYRSETDLSLFAQKTSPFILGGIIGATWGPMETVTTLTSLDDLLNYFGRPSSTSANAMKWYGFREFFRLGSQAQVVRHDSTASPAAKGMTSLRGARPETMESGTNGVATVATGDFTSVGATFITKGVLPGMYLRVTASLGGADLGIHKVLTVPLETKVTVSEVFGGETACVYEVLDTLAEEGADGATSAAATREFSSAGSDFTTNNVEAGDILVISDAGTSDDDGVYSVVTKDSAIKVTVDRDFPVGSKAALDFRIYKSKKVVDSGTQTTPGAADGATTAAASTLTAATGDFVKKGVVAGDILVINDALDTGSNGQYIVTNVAATILTLNRATAATLNNLNYYVYPASVRLEGYYKGSRSDDFTLSVIPNVSTTTDWDLYVYDQGVLYDKVIGTNLTDIETDMDSSLVALVTGTPVVAGATQPVPQTTLAVNGGLDGIDSANDSDKIVALEKLRNREEYSMSCLIACGEKSQNVQTRMYEIVEYRGDSIVLIDGPEWASVDTVQEIIQWANGEGGFGRTVALNSSFGELAWTEQQVYDEWNAKDIYVAPSAFLAYAWVTATKNGTAFPPAGRKRAQLPQVTESKYSPKWEERELMQGGTEIVNPIVKVVGKGTFVYGQKSTLRLNSALNRITNRYNFNQFQKAVLDAAEYEAFDPSDIFLWQTIENLLQGLGDYYVSQRVFANYRARCDAATNATAVLPADAAAQAYFWVQFPEWAEKIFFQFVVTPSGVDIAEVAATMGF